MGEGRLRGASAPGPSGPRRQSAPGRTRRATRRPPPNLLTLGPRLRLSARCEVSWARVSRGVVRAEGFFVGAAVTRSDRVFCWLIVFFFFFSVWFFFFFPRFFFFFFNFFDADFYGAFLMKLRWKFIFITILNILSKKNVYIFLNTKKLLLNHGNDKLWIIQTHTTIKITSIFMLKNIVINDAWYKVYGWS